VLDTMPATAWTSGVEDDNVVRLSGTLDRRSAERVRPIVVAAVDATGPGRDLVLDLSDVSYVDSCGLGLLLAAHRRAAAAGCRLILRAPGPGLVRAIAVTRLNRVLHLAR
jgi:anti-sigma B factor antagonist